MHVARKTTEEQYQLVWECRRRNGINPNTFYRISKLRKKACYSIPESSAVPIPDSRLAQEIVKVDIMPEELPCRPLK